MYEQLSKHEEYLANRVVDIATSIHKYLGPGLLANVYEQCFCYELRKRGIDFKKHVSAPIIYDDFTIDDAVQIDILVDDLIIIQLKTQEIAHPIWEAQLLSYLKLTRRQLGFVLNFHEASMKDGIKRVTSKIAE
jgi:GxxExxY protein